MKISFDPDAWTARTAGYPRLVSAILFDISLHNWRTGTSMSLAHYGIITSDMPPEQANGIADMLCASGAIQQDDHGIWSPAAIEEWAIADKLRQQRGRGGSNSAGKPRRKPAQPQAPKAASVEPIAPAAPAASPAPPSEEDAVAIAKIEAARMEAQTARATLAKNIERLANAWNAMALKGGIPQIKVMTDKRKEQAGARIREHGIDVMLKAVESIPAAPFLTGQNDRGWKADIEFLLQPSSCLKLIEGSYHHDGEGKASGWR